MVTISATSIHIYWIAPELDSWDGDIIDYKVSCSSTFGFNHNGVISAEQTDYTLNLLRPFSNYTCCVLADTTKGPSSSSCATQETQQDSKHIACVNVNTFNHLHVLIAVHIIVLFNIVITGPADVPYNITVEAGSAFALYMKWAPPLIPNGIVTHYKIYMSLMIMDQKPS